MKKNSIYYALIGLSVFSTTLCGCGKKAPIDESFDKDWEYKDQIIDDKYRNYYEIFVGSFYDSDGDGSGDLRGVGLKMKYIHDMGFNGVWLMPIHPSISYHKYDVDDYYAIDKDYYVDNADEDFQFMMEKANEYDVNIIMDLVINHSSAKHKWFKDATKALNTTVCSSPDKDGRPNQQCINENKTVNYYNFYYKDNKPLSGVYRLVPGAENWYYESYFSENMPDLNLNDENLKEEIVNIMKYWMDKGVKGFRLDAALHFFNSDEKKNVEFLNWLNTKAKEVAPEGVDPYFVAEVWSGTVEQSYYRSGLDSFFNFSFSSPGGAVSSTTKHNASSFVEAAVEYEEKVKEFNENAIVANFLGNHDKSRSANAAVKESQSSSGVYSISVDPDYVKMSLALNQILSGTSWVYYGEEIGMISSNSGGDPSYRTAMLWSDDEEILCKNPPGSQTVEQVYKSGYVPGTVEEQEQNNDSILNFVKKATRLRYYYPEIARGKQTAITFVDDNNDPIDEYAILAKTYNDQTTYLLINLSDEIQILNLETDYQDLNIDYTLATNNLYSLKKGQKIEMQPLSITVLK